MSEKALGISGSNFHLFCLQPHSNNSVNFEVNNLSDKNREKR